MNSVMAQRGAAKPDHRPTGLASISRAASILSMKQAAKRRLRNNIGSWLILICSLLATRWAWNYSTAQAHERAQDLFDREVDRSTAALRERLAAYEDVLYGARGLFEASPTVSRTMFRDYVNGLQLGRRYPGIQAVEYVAYLTPEQKDAHVRAVRNEGFPSYSIRPPGDRSEYTAIIYVEPLNWRNQRAFGYDMLTEPVRRAALEYARDTGDTSISAKVRLVQETDKDVQAGFLMYLPLYRTGMPLDTVEQRRAALRGYFCSPFRMNDLMNGAIRERSPLASVQIFSGRAPSRDMMMYPSPSGEARAVGPPGSILQAPGKMARHLLGDVTQ